MREYITNVQKTMSLDNMRRYSRFTIELTASRRVTAEQKQQLMNKNGKIVDNAITGYSTIATKYQDQIKTLAAKLDVTPAMQECQQQVQNSTISQMTNANSLMSLPTKICDEMNSAYATFEKALESAYSKIGERMP